MFKSFLGSVESKNFISSSQPAIQPQEATSAIMRFTIKGSNDYLLHERTDYQILHFIGDVGALYQTLRDALSVVLIYFLRIEINLHGHLIISVFRKRNIRTEDSK